MSKKATEEFYSRLATDICFFASQCKKDGEYLTPESHQIEALTVRHPKVYLDWDRRCGKTYVMQMRILNFMLFRRYSSHVYLAPTWSQAERFCRELGQIIMETEFLAPLRQKPHNLKNIIFSIDGKPWSRFEGVAVGESMIHFRGAGITNLYPDEVRDISEDAWAAVLPSIRGQRMEPEIFAASSRFTDTPDDPTLRFRSDPLCKVISQRLCDVSIDANKQIYINRILINTQRKGLTAAELLSDLAHMTPEKWLCEYAGYPVSGTGNIYPEALLNEIICLDKSFDALFPTTFGVDYGITHDNSVICVLGNDNGVVKLLWVEEFPVGTEIDTVNQYVHDCKHRYPNTIAVCPDAFGLGEDPSRRLKNLLDRTGFKVASNHKAPGVKLSLEEKRSLISSSLGDMQKKTLFLFHHDRLVRELKALQLDKLKKSPYGSPDVFDAFILAYWGMKNLGQGTVYWAPYTPRNPTDFLAVGRFRKRPKIRFKGSQDLRY